MDNQALKAKVENDENDFKTYLKELLETDSISSKATIGISQQILQEGTGKLSDKQWDTFLSYGLTPDTYVEYCEMCAHDIPWSEMSDAHFYPGDSLCAHCRYQTEKN